MVNISTRPFDRDRVRRGSVAGIMRTRPSTPHTATRRPTPPPARPRSTLSVSSWRATRPRPAPSARRMAISRCRTDDRASSRFATFAHAISRTATDRGEQA